MKYLITVVGATLVVCVILAALTSGCDAPKQDVIQTRTTFLSMPQGCPNLYRVEYEGRIYLVNTAGGIVLHDPIPMAERKP